MRKTGAVSTVVLILGTYDVFYVPPKCTPKQLLLKLSALNSIESEIVIKKMLFLGRLISDAKSRNGRMYRVPLTTDVIA